MIAERLTTCNGSEELIVFSTSSTTLDAEAVDRRIDGRTGHEKTARLRPHARHQCITPDALSARLAAFGTLTTLDGLGALDAFGQPRKYAYITLDTTKGKLAESGRRGRAPGFASAKRNPTIARELRVALAFGAAIIVTVTGPECSERRIRESTQLEHDYCDHTAAID
ncbi:hypothetical protein EWM64_g4738 [Hericium alpestre]|uniref:Uncharacterized protein n=1 Tax=Hericium alpestre TaxID=135208 RepID=A0A4Y9ZYK0_9AGAM|nr:hypothetical protein EWM64_g4738 [Hericium alpestre]